MKDEILKRAMFAQPLSKSARNSGIMAGFEDEELEDMENEGMEDMPSMARTPQNPEILMNTLRGDMRSVDARYMELAQMVGEEAAMETPPEVLAMLQPQLAAQQGGIGALPQAAGMMPPQGAPMPPQGAPMPEQGGMPMPPGGGGIAPFSQGGAEAPPTPDGMPPIKAAVGAFITPATRLAQMLADKASSAGATLSNVGTAANTAAGRFLSQGFPQTFRPVFENVRGPGGRFTAEQTISYPTLTQHLSNLAGPEATALVSRFMPGSAATVGGIGGLSVAGLLREGASQSDLERAQLLKAYEQVYYQNRDRSIPMPSLSDRTNEQLIQDIQAMAAAPVPTAATPPGGPATPPISPAAAETAPAPAVAAPTGETTRAPTTLDFIFSALKAPSGEGALPKEGRAARTKKEYEENLPLFRELLGESKETAKTNALLLLADAGLKLAGTRKPTFAMAVAEAASGIPKGFAAIAAQAQEQEGKIKAAALSQAINTISEQDKYAQAELLEQGKTRRAMAIELLKKIGADKVVSENVGMGIRINKNKDTGSYINTTVDMDDPAVRARLGTPENPNRWTLKDTDNPFVVNRGPAPSGLASTPEDFAAINKNLFAIENSLRAVERAEDLVSGLYSPGTFFVDKYNKVLVPLSLGLLPASVNTEKASAEMERVVSQMTKELATVSNEGRVSVQAEKWARDMADGILSPAAFFKNPEVAAAGIASQKTSLLNARMALLNQAGLVSNEYVMRTPSLGTPTDPFVIPSDPAQQQIMFNYLRGTVGKIRDPNAGVYIRKPDGQVVKVSPGQLVGQ